MAHHTRWEQDVAVHQFIYPHLCSYSHMDIATIEQYLNDSRFTTFKGDRIYQAGLYNFFFFVLLLDEFSLFKGFTKTERLRIGRSINASKRYVTQILERMKRKPENRDAPENFLLRWKPVGTSWVD